MKTRIPAGYHSLLSVYDTQMAIGLLHRLFEDNLSAALNIYRVSAPLFVEERSGLNDNLNGVERPVSFRISFTGTEAHSGFPPRRPIKEYRRSDRKTPRGGFLQPGGLPGALPQRPPPGNQ